MSRRKKKREREAAVRAADGGTIKACAGCGRWPHSTARDRACPRCGMLVCRVCAEDQPHALSLDGKQMCPLPPGQAPVTYDDPTPLVSVFGGPMFPKPEKEVLAEGRARSKGMNA